MGNCMLRFKITNGHPEAPKPSGHSAGMVHVWITCSAVSSWISVVWCTSGCGERTFNTCTFCWFPVSLADGRYHHGTLELYYIWWVSSLMTFTTQIMPCGQECQFTFPGSQFHVCLLNLLDSAIKPGWTIRPLTAWLLWYARTIFPSVIINSALSSMGWIR